MTEARSVNHCLLALLRELGAFSSRSANRRNVIEYRPSVLAMVTAGCRTDSSVALRRVWCGLMRKTWSKTSSATTS